MPANIFIVGYSTVPTVLALPPSVLLHAEGCDLHELARASVRACAKKTPGPISLHLLAQSSACDAQARLSAFGEHLRHQGKCAIAHLAEGFQLALLPPAHGGAAELAAVFLGGAEPPPPVGLALPARGSRESSTRGSFGDY